MTVEEKMENVLSLTVHLGSMDLVTLVILFFIRVSVEFCC